LFLAQKQESIEQNRPMDNRIRTLVYADVYM